MPWSWFKTVSEALVSVLLPVEQVAEDEDEDQGEGQHPEEESLVLDRQLQVQESDMPYFLHDHSLGRRISGGQPALQGDHGHAAQRSGRKPTAR